MQKIMTLKEAAKLMGIATSRAGQLERQALDKLRKHPQIQEIARDMGLLKTTDDR